MPLLLGKKPPSFSAKAVVSGVEIVNNFTLEQFKGKYVVLFFYPKDFTLVCPTELFAFQAKLEEFKSKNVELVAVSTDTEQSHRVWLQMAKNAGGIQGVTFPLVADTNKTISFNYDVLIGDMNWDENGLMSATDQLIAYRGLFLIDKKGIVKHQSVNILQLGRNVDEVMRLVDALQHIEEHGEVCPANWTKGDETFK